MKVLVRLMGFLCDYLPINKKKKKRIIFFGKITIVTMDSIFHI